MAYPLVHEGVFVLASLKGPDVHLYRILARMLPPGSTILDLACGDGTFLREALQAGAGRVVGVELSEEGVLQCVAAGLAVYQGDITEGLADYRDNSFACVSLIRTVELLGRPEPVLREMLRVGRTAWLTFGNFGHWRHRLQYLLTGYVPTLVSYVPGLGGPPTRLSYPLFRRYCRKSGIGIVRMIPFPTHPLARVFPSLFARELAVLLEKLPIPRQGTGDGGIGRMRPKHNKTL